MNGQSVKSAMGGNCSRDFCSSLISIYVNNKREYVWKDTESTNMPKFNFTYVSLPIHRLSEVRVELWST